MDEQVVFSVLHVDDEPDLAAVTAEYLERHDDRFEIETATSASDGLDRLAQHDYDCVVSDYDMPGQNGIEFLHAVRDEYPDLPFILFTGKGSEAVASDAISAGVTDYLQKGGTEQYELLATRIENAVEKARMQAERQRQLHAIETAREGIAMLDDDFRFTTVNDAYASLFGYDPEEMVGESWELVYADETIADVTDEIVPSLREDEYFRGETPFQRSDGSTFIGDHVISKTAGEEHVCLARDITERKEREQELERKGRAMDEAPIGITITDPQQSDNPLIYANETFLDFTGYSRDEVMGWNHRVLQGPDTEDDPVAEMRRAIDAGESTTVELRNYRKDETMFWNRVSIAPLHDETGAITNWVGFQEDITDRKHQEKQLKQEQRRFQTLFEQLTQPLVEVEYDALDPIVIDVNPAFEETFGYRAEEVIGESLDAHIVPHDRRDEAKEINTHVREGGQLVSREVRRQTADGPRDFLLENAVYDDGSGGFAIYTDVTERKEHEDALEELHDATRDLMTATTTEEVATRASETARQVLKVPMNGIHLYDAETDALVPVAWTDKTEQLLDGSPPALPVDDSLAGQAYRTGEARNPADVCEADETFNPDTPFRSECILPLGDHGVFILSSPESDAFDATDEALTEVFAGNVTAALDHVEQQQQLQRERDRLDEFASVISHDLRNPLNVATTRLELAQGECDSAHLDEVAQAHDRMDALIDDVLTLARQGEHVNNPEAVDFADTIAGCWRTVETDEATIVIETELTIQADPSRLKQLLENLFRNAIEHGGKTVTVTVGDLVDGQGFYVADDGPGIPAGEREEVFDAGYSTTETGTGFGLSIVLEIVEAHGWDITVTDSETGGARFEITGVETVGE